ncbi:MAG: hypothetical protein V4550_20870 [Gemmatimonadota bacterium]
MATDDAQADDVFVRAKALQSSGLSWSHAWGVAALEQRLLSWPAEWEDRLHILVYGDFEAPSTSLNYPTLGISISQEQVLRSSNSIDLNARTTLKGTITISERTVAGVSDAIARANVVCGILTLADWGNNPVRWWCWITHLRGGGTLVALDAHDVAPTVSAFATLPLNIQRKVATALYWIRESRNLMNEVSRDDTVRTFAAYWNAFECLIDAVLLIRPLARTNDAAKQAAIDEYLRGSNGRLTLAQVRHLYHSVADPAFSVRAKHALEVCFGPAASLYINEVFYAQPRSMSLSRFRNAIAHGFIDAEDPEQLIVLNDRTTMLWRTVWGMFGRIIPFAAPADLGSALERQAAE